MDAKERGEELAAKYLRGECNEVQLNYLAHQIGFSTEEMESLIEHMSYGKSLERASMVVISLIFFHFFSCFLYAIFSLIF